MGEVLSSDHQVHELYSDSADMEPTSACPSDSHSLSCNTSAGSSAVQVTVNSALLARVEVLDSDNLLLNDLV